MKKKLEELREKYQYYCDLIEEKGDEYDIKATEIKDEFEELFNKYLYNCKITVSYNSNFEISYGDIEFYSEQFLEGYDDLEDLIKSDIYLSPYDLTVTIEDNE